MGLLTHLKEKGATLLFGELITEAGSAPLEAGSDATLALSIRQRSNAAPHLQLSFNRVANKASYEITRLKEAIPYFERAARMLRQSAASATGSLGREETSPAWLTAPFDRLKDEIFGEVLVDLGNLEMDDHGRELSLSIRRFPKKPPFLYLRITSVGDKFVLQTSSWGPLAQLLADVLPVLQRYAA